MIHVVSDLPLAKLLIQKFGDQIIFQNCSLVKDHTGAYFGKRPEYIGQFKQDLYI
jgi:hypothetical protein